MAFFLSFISQLNSFSLSTHFLYSNFFFCSVQKKKTTETINNRIRIHIVTNYLRSTVVEKREEKKSANERMEVKNRKNPF